MLKFTIATATVVITALVATVTLLIGASRAMAQALVDLAE